MGVRQYCIPIGNPVFEIASAVRSSKLVLAGAGVGSRELGCVAAAVPRTIICKVSKKRSFCLVRSAIKMGSS